MSAEPTPGLVRERISTRLRLNTANRRQTQEMKRKLKHLRNELTAIAQGTRDDRTRAQLHLLIDQVVVQLEKLEDQDDRTQGEERRILEWEARRDAR